MQNKFTILFEYNKIWRLDWTDCTAVRHLVTFKIQRPTESWLDLLISMRSRFLHQSSPTHPKRPIRRFPPSLLQTFNCICSNTTALTIVFTVSDVSGGETSSNDTRSNDFFSLIHLWIFLQASWVTLSLLNNLDFKFPLTQVHLLNHFPYSSTFPPLY